MTAETVPPKIFISYSRKDVAWKDRVLEQLRVLEFAGELIVWDDERINAGNEWLKDIETAMSSAEVAVLLISADFLTSSFIRRSEIPRLLDRRQTEGLRVIPIFVRPCAWSAIEWLASLQGRPRSGRTLSELRRHQVEKELAGLALEIGELLGRAPDKQVATEPKTGADSPPVSLALLATGSVTQGGVAFTPAAPEPAALSDDALRDREPSLDLQQTSDKEAPTQTGPVSLLVSDPRSGTPAPHLAGPETDGGPSVSVLSETDLLDEALENSETSSELRPDSDTAATPQPEGGSRMSLPRSESRGELPAGAETERGPAPGEPSSSDETLRRHDPGREFRRARIKSIIALTLSLYGLLLNLNFLADIRELGFKVFVFGLVAIFSLAGLGLGNSAGRDLDRLKIRKMKWAGALATRLGCVAVIVAICVISILK